MVEIIGRISKGSKMDQIYIPKNRAGFGTGEYVLISPLRSKVEEIKLEKKKHELYFNNVGKLEPIKIRVIEDIMGLIDKKIISQNIIITGSFLDEGFGFNDIDILILSEEKINIKIIEKDIRELEGIKAHVIILGSKTLSSGLPLDPLYIMMLSKCVSKNRLIFRIKRKINYKLLDINLLKSKTLIDNFDALNGNEKYYFTMNMISILLFIKGLKLTKDLVNRNIEKIFNVKIKDIKDNTLQKQDFIKKYKEIFNKTFNLIFEGINKV
ncbi:MAG: hypothetical protein ABIH28_00930 [archaeon]